MVFPLLTKRIASVERTYLWPHRDDDDDDDGDDDDEDDDEDDGDDEDDDDTLWRFRGVVTV